MAEEPSSTSAAIWGNLFDWRNPFERNPLDKRIFQALSFFPSILGQLTSWPFCLPSLIPAPTLLSQQALLNQFRYTAATTNHKNIGLSP